MEQAGTMPCIMNAANEIAVAAFLNDKIGFLQMTDLIEKTMLSVKHIKKPSLNDYIDSNNEARAFAQSLVKE
jgi:1-deoxy-D-xylulose-5-phosphate reductoisomerase